MNFSQKIFNEWILSIDSLHSNDWEKVVDGLLTHQPIPATDSEWLDLASALESRATRMLLLSEYITQRKGGYCGDHNSHSVAAKAIARLHVKLRKALGYTVPTAGTLKL